MVPRSRSINCRSTRAIRSPLTPRPPCRRVLVRHQAPQPRTPAPTSPSPRTAPTPGPSVVRLRRQLPGIPRSRTYAASRRLAAPVPDREVVHDDALQGLAPAAWRVRVDLDADGSCLDPAQILLSQAELLFEARQRVRPEEILVEDSKDRPLEAVAWERDLAAAFRLAQRRAADVGRVAVDLLDAADRASARARRPDHHVAAVGAGDQAGQEVLRQLPARRWDPSRNGTRNADLAPV